MRQIEDKSDEESLLSNIQAKAKFEDSFRFQDQRERSPVPSTVVRDVSALQGQDVQISDVGYINEDEGANEEMKIMERIRVLQLQAEQMAHKSRQRLFEESQLKENMKIIDKRKRKFCKQMERQNKMLLMRQEEENLEKLLQQKHDEEMKQKQRLDMLQREEAFMRR